MSHQGNFQAKWNSFLSFIGLFIILALIGWAILVFVFGKSPLAMLGFETSNRQSDTLAHEMFPKAVDDYAEDAAGLVSEIGRNFFKGKKTILLYDEKRGHLGTQPEMLRFKIDNSSMQACMNNGACGIKLPVEDKSVRSASLSCRGISTTDALNINISTYAICISSSPFPAVLGVDGSEKHGYSDIPAGIPFFVVGTSSSSDHISFNFRFSVLEEEHQDRTGKNADADRLINNGDDRNQIDSVSHENLDPCSRLESNFQRTELPMAERISLMRELVDCRREHPEPDAASASEAFQSVDSSASKQQGQQDVAGDEVRNEENDRPIVAVLQEMPKYPSAAMRAGITGTVVVEVTVGADGNVDFASIHSSSNNRDLDRAALQAARRWKYSKSRNGGILRVPVNFGYDQVSSPAAGVATNHTSCPSEDIRGFVQKFRDSIPTQRSYTISGFSHTSLDENLEQITEVKSSAEIDFPVMVSNKETSGLTVDFSVRGSRATVHEQGIDSGVSATYVFEKREGCWYLVSLEDLST